VVLLNTCSVRDMADQKALGKMGMLGRLAKEQPHVVFGFLGCMAQARGESLLKNLPHVDLVVGTQKFHRVPDYVEELVGKKPARRRQFASSNSHLARRPLSFQSCKDATCIAPFASFRRRAEGSVAVQSSRSWAKCMVSCHAVSRKLLCLGKS